MWFIKKRRTRLSTSICALIAAVIPCTSALAQAPSVMGKLKISALHGTMSADGYHLEGTTAKPVILQTDGFYAQALNIVLGKDGQFTKVRAQGNVILKVDSAAPGSGTPIHVESNSDVAVLTTADRKLVLTGNVTGWYQQPGHPKDTLSGANVTMYYKEGVFTSDIDGGAGMMHVTLPAENAAQPTAIGTVVITAHQAHIDQGEGTAEINGDARAESNDGPNHFFVHATKFIITRDPGTGGLATLQTQGRTHLRMELPPEPDTSSTAGAATTPDAAGQVTVTTPDATTPKKTNVIKRPTLVEADADSATVTRATSTVVFEGNVTGYYRIISPSGQPQDYHFAGGKAVAWFVSPEAATAQSAAGMHMDVTGQPVTVEVPDIGLGFGK